MTRGGEKLPTSRSFACYLNIIFLVLTKTNTSWLGSMLRLELLELTRGINLMDFY